MTREAAHLRFRNEHRSRHGALSFSTVERLNSKPPVVFPIEAIVWSSVSDRQLTESSVRSLGVAVNLSPSQQPFFMIDVQTLHDLNAIARLPSVTLVAPVFDPKPQFHGVQDGNGLDVRRFTQSQSANVNGGFADEINVAIFESPGNGCKINEEHEAFTYNSIVYTGTNPSFQSCAQASDCECIYQQGQWEATRCNNGFCAGARHLNEVASMISRTHIEGQISTIQHAGKARLHILNSPTHGVCVPSKLNNLLQDLIADDVFLGTRSLACGDDESSLASVHDYFAREHGFLKFQSSGNNGGPDATVKCVGTNEICVGSVSHEGTPSYYSDDRMMYEDDFGPEFSATRNVTIQGDASDREKPDLVSLGHRPFVMDHLSTGDWTDYNSGTSYAAPAAAGLAALLWEYCVDTTGLPLSTFQDQLMWRARMRAAALPDHRLENYFPEYAYPTPGALLSNGDLIDSQAGAGISTFNRVKGFCRDPKLPPADGSAADPVFGDISLTVSLEDSDWTSVPDEIAGQTTQTGTPATSQALKLGGGLSKPIRRIQGFENGGRIRLSLAMNSCPGETDGEGAGWRAPSVDFDIALCEPGVENGCVAISESFYAADEGFDVVIPAGTQELELLILAPQDWPVCETSSSAGEDIHVSYVYWRY